MLDTDIEEGLWFLVVRRIMEGVAGVGREAGVPRTECKGYWRGEPRGQDIGRIQKSPIIKIVV